MGEERHVENVSGSNLGLSVEKVVPDFSIRPRLYATVKRYYMLYRPGNIHTMGRVTSYNMQKGLSIKEENSDWPGALYVLVLKDSLMPT